MIDHIVYFAKDPLAWIIAFLVVGALLTVRSRRAAEAGSETQPGTRAFARARRKRAGERGWAGTIDDDPIVEGRCYFRPHKRKARAGTGAAAARAHVAEGRTHARTSNHQRAETCFRAAMACDPPSMVPHAELAQLLEDGGRRPEALRHYAEAQARDPGNFELARRLVVAQHAVGQDASTIIDEMRVLWQATMARAAPAPAAAMVDSFRVNERDVCAFASLTHAHEGIFFQVSRQGTLEGFVRMEQEDGAPFGSPYALYFGNLHTRARLGPPSAGLSSSNFPSLKHHVVELLQMPAHSLVFTPRPAGTAPLWVPANLELPGRGSAHRVMLLSPPQQLAKPSLNSPGEVSWLDCDERLEIDESAAAEGQLDDGARALLGALKAANDAGKRGLGGAIYIDPQSQESGALFVADTSTGPSREAAVAQIRLGCQALGRGDNQAAAAIFQSAVSTDPPSWEGHHWLAEALSRLERFPAALHHRREAYARNASCFELARLVVVALHATGERAEAQLAEARSIWRARHAPTMPAAAAACVDKLVICGRYAYVYSPLLEPEQPMFVALFRGDGVSGQSTHEGCLMLEHDGFGSSPALYFVSAAGRARLASPDAYPIAANYPAVRQQLIRVLHALPARVAVNEPRLPGTVEWAQQRLELEAGISPMAIAFARPSGLAN